MRKLPVASSWQAEQPLRVRPAEWSGKESSVLGGSTAQMKARQSGRGKRVASGGLAIRARTLRAVARARCVVARSSDASLRSARLASATPNASFRDCDCARVVALRRRNLRHACPSDVVATPSAGCDGDDA